MLKQVRQCLHAGEWYTNDPNKLKAELAEYIGRAKKNVQPAQIKAIIAPHAGLYYSGPTAAWAYQYVNKTSNIDTVFLFGPSHHKYVPGCALTYVDLYATPMGPLKVDIDIVDELKKEPGFFMLDIDDEEDEHSLEMHLPYIVHTLGRQIKLVPILCGALNDKTASDYADIFQKYFERPNTLFIFSSDFCHWGQRFDYSPHNKDHGQIWQSIEKMDGQAMNIIQQHNSKAFHSYIKASKNTICGRHPITLFLKLAERSKLGLKTKFVKYSQSQQVKNPGQSSVSYASAITYLQNA